MTFRKRTARGKTLLQKGFPPGPPFRKLLNGCGVAMSQRQIAYPHTTRISILGSSLRGDTGGAASRKKEPFGLHHEQQSQ